MELDVITRNLKLDVERLTAENKAMRYQVALAKEAVQVMEAALRFYDSEPATGALGKLDEIRAMAKAR